jgi:hypothetical protein
VSDPLTFRTIVLAVAALNLGYFGVEFGVALALPVLATVWTRSSWPGRPSRRGRSSRCTERR